MGGILIDATTSNVDGANWATCIHVHFYFCPIFLSGIYPSFLPRTNNKSNAAKLLFFFFSLPPSSYFLESVEPLSCQLRTHQEIGRLFFSSSWGRWTAWGKEYLEWKRKNPCPSNANRPILFFLWLLLFNRSFSYYSIAFHKKHHSTLVRGDWL